MKRVVILLLVLFLVGCSSEITDEDVNGVDEIVYSAPAFHMLDCTDSDEGLDLENFGTVTYTADDGGVLTRDDVCIDEETLVEYRCTATRVKGSRIPCANVNGRCLDGVCIPCTDSDGGQNYYEKGHTTGYLSGVAYEAYDDCGYGNANVQLHEFYCEDGMVKSEFVDLPVGYTCEDDVDAFVEFEENCTDTDGGQNYYEKGTTTGLLSGVDYSGTDSCSAETGELHEFYCNGQNVGNEFVERPEGYVCDTDLDYFVDYLGCVDTDGGQDYYVKGTTTGIWGNIESTLSDRCSDGVLREYFCGVDGDSVTSESVNPPEGYTCDESLDIFIEM